MASDIEAIEILPGEDVPIAIKKSSLQMRGQRFQCFLIILVCRVNRIIENFCADEFVVRGIVLLRAFHSRGGLSINPQ